MEKFCFFGRSWASTFIVQKFQTKVRPARVEIPEQISAEQRCFRDFINFSADQRCFRMGSENQRCFRAVQRWLSLNQRCSALDQNESRNRRKCFVQVRKGIGITKNMFLWSVPAMKKSFRRNSSQIFELTHSPLPHASWSYVTCRIVKKAEI